MGHTYTKNLFSTFGILNLAQLWQTIHSTFGSAVIPVTSGSVWTQSQNHQIGPQLSLSRGLLWDPATHTGSKSPVVTLLLF